jgi:hypothetical protein
VILDPRAGEKAVECFHALVRRAGTAIQQETNSCPNMPNCDQVSVHNSVLSYWCIVLISGFKSPFGMNQVI